jgi:hypothetical protein
VAHFSAKSFPQEHCCECQFAQEEWLIDLTGSMSELQWRLRVAEKASAALANPC